MTPYIHYLSHERSAGLHDALNDKYLFCKGKGVIKLLGESTKNDYVHLTYCLEHRLPRCHNGVPALEYNDEILENKWLVHVYDLNGTLN